MTDDRFRQQILAQPPAWAHELLQPWDAELLNQKMPFVRREYWTDQGSVNVFNVVGTWHASYENKPWLYLLEHGRRMPHNLDWLARNPGYYTGTELKKPTMYFATLDGLTFYITDDGNHRTCLARFYFYERGLTQLHGVTIRQFDVDEAFWQLYQQIMALIKQHRLMIYVEPKRELLQRDDTAAWKTDHHQPYLLWHDDHGTTRLDYEAALKKQAWLQRYRPSFWRRWFA